MAYVRDKFIDPTGTYPPYVWQVNHAEEEDTQRQRSIERTAVTSGVGFVRQQGEDSPLIFRWTGTILHLNQIQQMLLYYSLCSTQTIHLRDFEGHKYEVLITSFNYKRRRTVRNPRDTSIPLHFYEYTIEIEALNYLGEDFS
jgi:hypothetical protein